MGFDRFWDLTFRRGRVEHATKEMVRLTMVTMLGCNFCGSQRSALALEDVSPEELEALPPGSTIPTPAPASLPMAHDVSPDVKTDWDPVYAELREHYDDAEVAELLSFTTIALGGVLVARTLDLD